MKIHASGADAMTENKCWADGDPLEPCWGELLPEMIGYSGDGDECWIYKCQGHSTTWDDDQYTPVPVTVNP